MINIYFKYSGIDDITAKQKRRKGLYYLNWQVYMKYGVII